MTDAHPFAGRRTRVLGVADIHGLIDMRETLDVQHAAFVALADGRVTSAPNSWLRLPDQQRRRGWLKILAGHDGSSQGLGVKVLARFADNPPGANLGSLVLLFDDENGFPLAIMDGATVTALRTGAGAGLATDVLATPDPATLGVVGTGVVAWYSLQAVMIVRPSIQVIRVFSRSEDRRRSFAERAAAELGVRATAVDSVGGAVRGAEVVVTGTNAPGPVLEREHVGPGQHINAMGIKTEIAPLVLADAWVIPDGVKEAIDDGKFSTALHADAVEPGDLGPQLGALLRDGTKRHDPSVISLFDSSGVAVQDVAMARRLWELAERRQRGVEVDLGLNDAVR